MSVPLFISLDTTSKVPLGVDYTFECQYAKAINIAWNGSLPQTNAGDVFIAAPFV